MLYLCVANCVSDRAAESKTQRSLSKINAHIKGNTHTREQQLRQACKIEKDASGGKVTCPLCLGLSGWKKGQLLRHTRKSLLEQFWEDGTDIC